ncbi:uncharacterized protein Proc-R isoform X2 [Eurosta solidaginis]|uniref:uncharacterized protein Proc-R isoform X2 n=1 Tax=Eurosta solidaginis TaxID=178769 RepID=UPI003530C7BF
MLNSADVAAVRHVVQRILVPCVFVIGLLGNSVSIYVLTRKRMRCTTNIYLTALAITDIIYLTMALLLSLKHYDYVQRHVEIFWKCYGYVVWLCDACAYISIYIAVCFTIERFIAIRYPLKRQTFCTESLAKKVITAFEHQYRITKKSIDIHGSACNLTQQANATERLSLLQLNYNENVRQRKEEEQQQSEQQHEQQQDNEQYLPLQDYMPLSINRIPMTPTPHNDFEGSGGQVVDAVERTERHWQRRETGAARETNNKGNCDSSSKASSSSSRRSGCNEKEWNNKGAASNAEASNTASRQLLTLDVISMRRLKHAVDLPNQTSDYTSNTTTTAQLTAPTTYHKTLPLPLQLTSVSTKIREWSILGEAASSNILKVTHAKGLKRSLLAPAAKQIPRMIANYFAFDGNSDLLLDTEFLVSTAIPLQSNDVQEEQQSDNENNKKEIEHEQLLADANIRAEEWKTQSQVKETTQENESLFFNITDYCEEVTYYQNSLSSLGENALYTRLWYFFTLFVFVLIPLCVLATFNCFLIMLVRRSKNLRGEMTNANSIRRSRMSGKGSRKFHSSSVSQENRITVTLIAVVLLFIVCQLPWAIYLIVSENVDIDNNVQAIIGNIFNFLAAINAAANFFLYCVLSDKYRKTVRELITGYKYRGHARNTSASASLYTSTHTTQAMNGSRRYRPTASTAMVVK